MEAAATTFCDNRRDDCIRVLFDTAHAVDSVCFSIRDVRWYWGEGVTSKITFRTSQVSDRRANVTHDADHSGLGRPQALSCVSQHCQSELVTSALSEANCLVACIYTVICARSHAIVACIVFLRSSARFSRHCFFTVFPLSSA